MKRNEAARVLISLGKEVSRDWKFCLRNENTPSAIINDDGRIHDFGDGFHGDIYDALMHVGIAPDFISAKKIVNDSLGVVTDVDFSTFDNNKTSEIDYRPLPENFLLPHLSDARKFNREWKEELENLFQGAASWNKIYAISKKYQIGYNYQSGRLIMPIRNVDGKISTFWRYKRDGDDVINEDGTVLKHKKVLFTKKKYRPIFAINDMVEYRKDLSLPISIVEGEKDCLVALANGLRAVCVGGAGKSKKMAESELELFKDTTVILCGDYDEAGKKFNENLAEQLKNIAKKVIVLDWEVKSKKDGFKLHPKFDMTDYFAWKNKRGCDV